MANIGTAESDIRLALHAQRLRRAKSHPDTLVINELGLAHARCRVDVAVINGSIHGYEIKSSRDTLDRLNSQVEVYQRTLQKLTIVAAPKHITEIMARVPKWCGIITADRGPRGGIVFTTMRNAVNNCDVESIMLAHLLWRNEVISLLTQIGYAPKDLRRPRKHLYEMLCETMTIRDITASIRTFMVQRQTWQDRLTHASCGD